MKKIIISLVIIISLFLVCITGYKLYDISNNKPKEHYFKYVEIRNKVSKQIILEKLSNFSSIIATDCSKLSLFNLILDWLA